VKYFFIGIVVAVVVSMLTIYASDLFLFDIPIWAAWPFLGVPMLSGAAAGMINCRHAHQNTHHLGHRRHLL
jgi:hypothetical protein